MTKTPPRHVFRFVYLPQRQDGKPAGNACRHLAEFDGNGQFIRFHRQKPGKLQLAAGGMEILEERRELRRIKRFVALMKAMGFYQNR